MACEEISLPELPSFLEDVYETHKVVPSLTSHRALIRLIALAASIEKWPRTMDTCKKLSAAALLKWPLLSLFCDKENVSLYKMDYFMIFL